MRKSSRALLIFILMSFSGCAMLPEEAAKRPIVIKGGLLIDGTGREPIPNSAVVIQGGTIKAAGALGQVILPDNADIIDATDKVVLPGLIDMHVHYRDWEDQLFISHGVTTVRDVGNTLDYILEARKQSHKQGARKPRIYTCGPFLDGSPPVFAMTLGKPTSYPALTPEEAAAAASRLINSKVDCLKIQQKITLPMLKAIAEVAKKENMPVTAHLGDVKMGNIKAAEAIALGIKGLEHGSGINFLTVSQSELEGVSNLIVSNSVFVVVTLFMDEQLSRLLDPELKKDPLLKQVPPGVFVSWEDTFGVTTWWTERHANARRAMLRKKMQFIRILVQKGGAGLIVAGTDVPVPYVFPGVSLHREVGLLVSAGLTPMQAIMAATKNAAQLLGHSNELGTLEAGKTADVQLLGRNPLEDISNLGSVELVLRDGTVIWRKEAGRQ